MKDYLKKFRENTEKNVPAMTGEQLFFTENNVNGFFSIEEFTKYFYASSETERDHLDQALDLMSQGAVLNGFIKPSFDKISGHQINWLRIKLPKGDFPPLRVLHDERMQRFFRAYQRGEFTSSIMLENLVKEAGL